MKSRRSPSQDAGTLSTQIDPTANQSPRDLAMSWAASAEGNAALQERLREDQALRKRVLEQAKAKPGVPLPNRDRLEQQIGGALPDFQVHFGESTVTSMLEARAIALGDHLFFAEENPPEEVILHEGIHGFQTGGAGADATQVASTSSAAENEAHAATAQIAAGKDVDLRANAAPNQIHRWVAPTDWFDYIGLAVDLVEKVYIEVALPEGEEKQRRRLMNLFFTAIDLVLAAMPGAGGGGLAARGSLKLAGEAWMLLPATAQATVVGQVAKGMGWTTIKTTQALNHMLHLKKGDKGGGKGSGGKGGKGGNGGSGKYNAGDDISLGRFTKEVRQRKGPKQLTDPKTGEYIIPDRARNSGAGGHGGSFWKLFDKKGKRIGTISKDGKWLRK